MQLRELVRPLAVLLPPTPRRQLLYLSFHSRWPDLRSPRTFTEKVNWRILHDRRDLLRGTCDKLAMKEHALGSGAGVRVPRTLWSGTDVRELARLDLPAHWVLKPNHRTNGLVHFGAGPVADPEPLVAATRGWLAPGRSPVLRDEWAYRSARRCLLVEEAIGGAQQVPRDLKVIVLGGAPVLVEVHEGRFHNHTVGLFRPDWTPVPTAGGGMSALAPPRQLPELLTAAARLAAGFDCLRVDLYEADGQLWFGELTPYPGGGLESTLPPALDRELGERWVLPDPSA